MGYKLAGFDVIGCNEIDPKMMKVYKENHNPKYSYLESIEDFKLRDDYPDELYDLDILDGSPPCSSFSMAGNREKDWGKEKRFREGQKKQILDRLFFDFIDLAKRIKPKVIVAENVKGLIAGNARKYVNDILIAFDDIGYHVDFNLLNASIMGVPQRRERVFFYAIRKDIYEGEFTDLFSTRPRLDLDFNEDKINYSEFKNDLGRKASSLYFERWKKRIHTDNSFGDITERLNGTGSCFSDVFAKDECVLPTLTSKGGIYDFDSGHFIGRNSFLCGGTFPKDYNFLDNKVAYLVGMSVPPVMMAQVANRIYKQWLKRLKPQKENNK